MKKIISVLLCVIMAVAGMSLAACTPDGGDPNGGFETTGELIKDENGNIVYDDVIICLTTVVTGEDKDTLQNLVGRFNREYKNKIMVTMTGIGESTFEADVSRQLVNNNNPPDFIMSHQEGLKSLADVKLIQPLENIMNVSGIGFEMSDYANALSQYAYLGTDKLYSVPSDAQSVMVLYNKDVLKACGYDQLPENHDELVTLCAEAKNKKYTPIAWSTSFEQFQSYVFVTALLQNGAELYNPNGYRAEWVSNAQNKKAFENTMQSIRDLTSVSPADDTTANILNKFLNNEALFYVAAPWNMSSVLTAYINNNKDLGIESVDNLAEHIGGTSMANWFALDKTKTYKGRDFSFGFLMLWMAVPSVLGTAPSYAMFALFKNSLQLTGVASYLYIYTWLILPSCTGIFNVLLMHSFFRSIPKDIVESAKCDGAKNMTIFRRLLVPLAKSTIMLIVLFTFISAWNSLMWPQLLLSGEQEAWWTVTYALTVYYTGGSNWGALGISMATCVFSLIPIIIIFVIAQNKMIDGLASSGVKM